MFQISFVFIQGARANEIKKKAFFTPCFKKKKLPKIFNNFLTFSADVCYRKQIFYTLNDERNKMKKNYILSVNKVRQQLGLQKIYTGNFIYFSQDFLWKILFFETLKQINLFYLSILNRFCAESFSVINVFMLLNGFKS